MPLVPSRSSSPTRATRCARCDARPALAAAAILTLALGVGANTAIFSAVNAVILRPLPFPNAESAVHGLGGESGEGLVQAGRRAGQHVRLEASRSRRSPTSWRTPIGFGTSTLTDAGEPFIVKPAFGTGNFFSVLGARAALGRTFWTRRRGRTGQTPVAVLSHHLWRDRFGSDPKVVGRTIQLDGAPVQVVGVMPAGFEYPNEKVDLWQPWALESGRTVSGCPSGARTG